MTSLFPRRHLTGDRSAGIIILACLAAAAALTVITPSPPPGQGAPSSQTTGPSQAPTPAEHSPASDGEPTGAPDAPLDPAADVIGVVLTLNEELGARLRAEGLTGVLGQLTEPLNAAAIACGAVISQVEAAGGGLVVRLTDPALNACLIERLATAEHLVAAEEDIRMSPK